MLRNKHLKLEAQQVVTNVLCYFERERDNGGAFTPFTSVMQRTAEACGISSGTLTTIKKRFNEAAPNQPQISTKSVYIFVGCHVTVETLKQEVAEAGVFTFSFKKDDGRRGLFELEHIATSRIRFLRNYIKNKELKDYNPVFLDETWIFSRGSIKKSWHDNTTKSIKKKPMGEGKRFIVLNAGNKDGFIPNFSLLFSTKNPNADYYGGMCGELFTKWFEEQLLPNLSEPSLIVMDNASYHSMVLEKTPTISCKKEDICSYLEKHNIPFKNDMFKRDLLELVKNNSQSKVYAIDEIAFKNGHKVLRLPPYHCQFNPIELVWANCKE